ncbi:MAG: hypothetical protein ACK4QW_09910 [Alphaproteobacteria bacterium]
MNGTGRSEDRLYELLPSIYRERDAEQGGPLRALLRIVQRQADALEGDIAALWDNAFVETAAPWVVPYIGDLVGTTPLFDVAQVRQPDTARALFPDLTGPSLLPEIGLRARADVAKTIYYRRRKGTLPMLEELARDVTGWAAHAVEFFELLGWTQNVRNHVRHERVLCPDIRSPESVDRLDGAFDHVAHTVDVRPPGQSEGWWNIRNVGLFLWRLRSFEAERVTPRRLGAADDWRMHFSPLGQDAPLFSRLRREGDPRRLATEFHVPQPIRPALFFEDLRAYAGLAAPAGFTAFYGLFDVEAASLLPQAPGASLMVFHDNVPVPPERVRCANLSVWSRPADDGIAVDVVRGRLTLGELLDPALPVEVWYHHGFPADLGGGPYRRRAWQVRRDLAHRILTVDGGGAAGTFATIADALTEWANLGRPDAVIAVRDNRTYPEALTIEPADGGRIAIEAADGARPHLRLPSPLTIVGQHDAASVTLSGLLIEGVIHVEGSLGRLRLLHTTIVPGGSIAEPDPDGPPPVGGPPPPAVLVASEAGGEQINQTLHLELAFSITGPLRLPRHAAGLWALDSIIDGAGAVAIADPAAEDAPGPAAWLERVTLVGAANVRELTLASEVIFDGVVTSERRQTGCVRFSYVAPGSTTPQRYRCQPDLRIADEVEAAGGDALSQPEKDAVRDRVRGWLRPEYTAEGYGQPAYRQLHLNGPREIATGAEDGSEMGAYCHLKQPQREANLRVRLEEYLPFGLEAGVVYVT